MSLLTGKKCEDCGAPAAVGNLTDTHQAIITCTNAACGKVYAESFELQVLMESAGERAMSTFIDETEAKLSDVKLKLEAANQALQIDRDLRLACERSYENLQAEKDAASANAERRINILRDLLVLHGVEIPEEKK